MSIRSEHLIPFLSLLAFSLFPMLSTARADALPVTFSGEVDSDGPLVIDPSADDSPVTLSVSNTMTDVYFIERMPQTKTVTSVTLGDFGQGNCSSSSPTARLYVRSHDNNDYNGASAQLTSGPEVPLPATPGRLTFTFDWTSTGGGKLLMSAGNAYTFMLQVNGCSSFKQTTWAPLEPRMETPSRSCLTALPFGPYGGVDAKMQWHDSFTQPDGNCVNWQQDLWDYEPDGWLVSIQPGPKYIDYIGNVGGTPDPDGHHHHYCDQQQWPGRNVSQVEVEMPTGFPDMQLDGVCRWNSYYPPGQQTRYTWSTALPWREETGGGPRLPYLKLDTVDWDNTLLQQYAPAMKFDSSEAFLPEDARGVASIAPSDSNCSDDANGLSNRHEEQDPDTHLPAKVDTRYANAGSEACPAQNQLSMDDLGPVGAQYPYLVGGQHPTVTATDEVLGDHLDLRGGFSTNVIDSQSIYAVPGWGGHVYGRVVQAASGGLWLQYFFWYYYNNGGFVPGTDDHEGDWEGIQIHVADPFASNVVPDRATYNEHDFRSVCGWNLVEKAGGHPVVYVSNGRHASYFTPDKMPSAAPRIQGQDPSPDSTDATVNTPSMVPHVEPITAYTPGWIRWPGRWGDSTGDWTGGGGKSPTGPATFPLWQDPVGWDSAAAAGAANLPADVGCPDSAPVARAAKIGTGRLRTHSSRGEGRAPTIRWQRTAGRKIRVAWSLPSSARVVSVELSVHATNKLFPATLVRVSARTGRRHGVATVMLPRTRGPFELVARSLRSNGRPSDEATARIRTA